LGGRFSHPGLAGRLRLCVGAYGPVTWGAYSGAGWDPPPPSRHL